MTLTHKIFHVIAGVLFLLLAVIHSFRIIYGWTAVVGGWPAPIWLSGIGALVAIYMAYWSLKTM